MKWLIVHGMCGVCRRADGDQSQPDLWPLNCPSAGPVLSETPVRERY